MHQAKLAEYVMAGEIFAPDPSGKEFGVKVL
jgi:hypothetical protein